ncbi:MAG TPA: hypothetical protein VHL85_08200 [Burkholderiales bacterium]|jgi:ubiquinone biosynthesis protein UbiJ|nr:hypothetical protein [Burkholderiales bacterium]
MLTALNRLLEKEAWAREHLAPFEGAVVEGRVGPLVLRAAIVSSGYLGAAPAGIAPAAIVSAVPGKPKVEGEEPLAEALRLVLQHLRWDAEEDLSRVVGDVAARRLVEAGRAFIAWQRDAGQRLLESASDYLARENGLLATRRELAEFSAALQEMETRIGELERRVGRLG